MNMKNENTSTVEVLAPRGIQIEKGDELHLKGTDRIFVASGGGFGCNPASSGNAVFGHWKATGSPDRVERYQVSGIVKAPNDPDKVEMERIAGRLDDMEGKINSLLEVFLEELNNIQKVSTSRSWGKRIRQFNVDRIMLKDGMGILVAKAKEEV